MIVHTGKGKIQKVTEEGTVNIDYNEILSTTGYKYLPNLIFEKFIDCDEMATALEITFDELIEKLNGEEDFHIEEATIIKEKFFPDLPMTYIFEKAIDLREITYEFDGNFGATSCRIETLKNIDIELGHIAEDVRETDLSDLTKMGLQFRDINHKIMLLSELMSYTVDDLEENHEHTRLIKDSYFDLIVNPKDQSEKL